MSKKKNTTPENENTDTSYQGILGDYQEEETESSGMETDEKNTEGTETVSPKKKASKKKVLTIVGISAASVALVGCLSFAGIGLLNKSKTNLVAQTEHYEVDSKILACYYQDVVSMFTSYYGEEALLNYYGMDVNAPLNTQAYPYDESKTWYDIIMDQAKDTLTQQLVVCEAAIADGFEMSERTKQSVEDVLLEADLEKYGNGVTEEDLRIALEIQAYSTEYYNHYMDSLDVTNEEIEAYYAEHEMEFLTCGLAGFSVSYDTEESGNEEDGMTQETAKQLAEGLQASKTPEEFEEKVASILTEYEGYTEEELESTLPSIYNTSYSYSAGSELCEWAFGDAKVNETYMMEGTGVYYIYMMMDTPSRDETPTVNVRHILFKDQENNEQAAKDALEEWKNGEATEDSFAALAEQYSEDDGSNTNGGLYRGVAPGEMVEPFNDWCFNDSRKPGDTDIVETDYGFHVMYFSSEGEPQWKNTIVNLLEQQTYSAWYAEQAELYPVEMNEDAVNTVVG